MSNILKYKRRSTFRISKMNNRSIIFDHVHLQQKRSEINIMYSQECLRLRLYCIIQPSAERWESGVRQGRWNWLGYILRDIRRAECQMKTKTYLKKDCWERTKKGVLEELGNSQSSCTRQKMLVRQHEGLMHLLVWQDMMMMMMMMMIFLPRFTTFAIARISSWT